MKKTLLFTIDFAPRTGGVAKYYENMCAYLPYDKITVLCQHEKGENGFDRKQKYAIYRKNLILRSPIWPKWIFSPFHLHNAVKREQVELILVGQLLPIGTVAWLYKKIFKIPYGIFIHGMDLGMAKQKKRKYKLAAKILKDADFIITNSDYTKKTVANFDIEEYKIFVVYPFVEVPQIKGDQKPKLIASLRKNDRKVILTLGRLVKRKGQDMVIQALPKILKHYSNFIYVIAGDGQDKKYLYDLAIACNVENKIIFAGEISDMEKAYYYSNCDIFIMPSRNIAGDAEGFGIVYLEAALYGKPSIAGRSGGAPEAVLDGQTGILTDPENIDEIANTVIKLLDNPCLLNKLGVQSRERVLRDFTRGKQIKKVEHLLS